MPSKFSSIKITARKGRGDGCDGMLEDFINDEDQYEAALEVFKENTESEQKEVVDELNRVQSGLGDAFGKGKTEFECAALDLPNHEALFLKL